MSISSEKLISAYYEAFNSKCFDDMVNLLAEDVLHDTNQGSRSQGKSNFTSFLKEMDLFYDEILKDIVIMVTLDGKRASAEFICHGTYKSSAPGLPPAHGQKYKLPVGCFFEIRGDLISRVTNYYNFQDWLKQIQTRSNSETSSGSAS